MSMFTRARLSIMMFLQFFVWGAWYVTAPNYLGTIGFTAADFSWTYSVGPIAGLLTPLLVGMVADRFFAAQRVLGVMHLLGAAIMYGATRLMQADAPSPTAINAAFFGYMLTYFPTLALTNTVAMRSMTNPEREFPSIRVFGTIGWIAAGWVLSKANFSIDLSGTQLVFAKLETSIGMFYVAAAAAALLGVLCFFLPHTPPVKDGNPSLGQLLGLDAVGLLKDPSYLVFMVSSVLICIPLAFYYQIASRVVEMTGLPIGSTMSYGQMSEIFFMIVMPLFFVRLGVKWMLFVGMLAWVVRYALFSLGAPVENTNMIIAGILLHGICYDFFFVTGQIYTDRKAPQPIRAQAQGLLVMLTLGLGMLIGAQTAGYIEGQHTTEKSKELATQVAAAADEAKALQTQVATATGAEKATLEAELAAKESERANLRREELRAIEWKPLWGKPAIFAALIMVFFALLFRDRTGTGEPVSEGDVAEAAAREELP